MMSRDNMDKKNLERNKLLMNPATGVIKTGNEWLNCLSAEYSGFLLHKKMNDLIEVKRTETGFWVDVDYVLHAYIEIYESDEVIGVNVYGQTWEESEKKANELASKLGGRVEQIEPWYDGSE